MSNHTRLLKEIGKTIEDIEEIQGLIIGREMLTRQENYLIYSIIMEDSNNTYVMLTPNMTKSRIGTRKSAKGPGGTYGLAAAIDAAVRERMEVTVKGYEHQDSFIILEMDFGFAKYGLGD